MSKSDSVRYFIASITKTTLGRFGAHLLLAHGVSQEKDLPRIRTCFGIAGWHTAISQQEKATRIPKLSACFVAEDFDRSLTSKDTRSHVRLDRVDYSYVSVWV